MEIGPYFLQPNNLEGNKIGQSTPVLRWPTENHDKIYDRRVANPLGATMLFWWFPNMVACNKASGYCLTKEVCDTSLVWP